MKPYVVPSWLILHASRYGCAVFPDGKWLLVYTEHGFHIEQLDPPRRQK